MPRRQRVPSNMVAEVISSSRRRCCVCYGLLGDLALKKGQIAHLDRDPSNNDLDNLAFLCLEHHDIYDSRTSQSKGFDSKEVKKYRQELYEIIQGSANHDGAPIEPVVDVKREARATIAIELSLMITGDTYQIEIPLEANLGRVVDAIIKKIGLPTNEDSGHSITWEMYSDTRKITLDRALTVRENHLDSGERVGLWHQMRAG